MDFSTNSMFKTPTQWLLEQSSGQNDDQNEIWHRTEQLYRTLTNPPPSPTTYLQQTPPPHLTMTTASSIFPDNYQQQYHLLYQQLLTQAAGLPVQNQNLDGNQNLAMMMMPNCDPISGNMVMDAFANQNAQFKLGSIIDGRGTNDEKNEKKGIPMEPPTTSQTSIYPGIPDNVLLQFLQPIPLPSPLHNQPQILMTTPFSSLFAPLSQPPQPANPPMNMNNSAILTSFPHFEMQFKKLKISEKKPLKSQRRRIGYQRGWDTRRQKMKKMDKEMKETAAAEKMKFLSID